MQRTGMPNSQRLPRLPTHPQRTRNAAQLRLDENEVAETSAEAATALDPTSLRRSDDEPFRVLVARSAQRRAPGAA